MSIIEELNKKNEEKFPQNKIILIDGRELDCYPLAQEVPEKLEDDRLELDKTGQYLIIGHGKPTQIPLPSPTVVEQRQLFVDNAFFLLAHSERILSDSRMFLCPVAIQNGIAYTGTSGFSKPTLGVYVEWWLLVRNAMQTDQKGRRRLVYQLAGSPLSGMNKCGAIREDGQHEIVNLSSFGAHWVPFMKLNQRYTEAKQLYQAYTLQEVLGVLHQEDNGNNDCTIMIDNLFMKHQIDNLNSQMGQIREQCQLWRDKYINTLTKYNEEKMRQLYINCETFEAIITKEIDSLKEQKRNLKASLRKGSLDNVSYQRQLSPLKKRISDLQFRIGKFQYDKVREAFPDEEDIKFSMIEAFVRKNRNDSEK